MINTNYWTTLQRKIVQRRKWGWTYYRIMESLGCSEVHVYKTCRTAGLVKDRKKVKAKRKLTRAAKRRNR